MTTNTFLKHFLIIFILILNYSVMAQKITTNDIISIYTLAKSDPQGKQTIVIFPDNTFVSVYFGGIKKGTWQLRGNTVYFTTDAEPQIVVYGRKLETLKDTTQLDFSGEFNQRAKVNLNIEASDVMQQIFNAGANCKNYPYIYKTTKSLKKVSFALYNTSKTNTDAHAVFNQYTFEIPENYNDILIASLSPEYSTIYRSPAVYKNESLYFFGDKAASKRPLKSISEEDMTFYKRFLTTKLLPDVLSYENEVFPHVENPTKDTLQSFYIIQPTSVQIVKEIDIKVVNGSLYTATCD